MTLRQTATVALLVLLVLGLTGTQFVNRVPIVAALPANCTIASGAIAFLTTPGTSGLYYCGPTDNNWTLAGGTSAKPYTAGFGMTLINNQFSIDSAVTETRAIHQSGADNTCAPTSNNGLAYTCSPITNNPPGVTLLSYTVGSTFV